MITALLEGTQANVSLNVKHSTMGAWSPFWKTPDEEKSGED